MTSDTEPTDETAKVWAKLTEKQRDCLDLLLEHKTSKEIARVLDISKDTVDQRLKAARETLGARNRAETAVLYGQLKSIYDRIVYGAVEVTPEPHWVRSQFPDGDPANLTDLNDGTTLPDNRSRPGSLFRELGRHDHGTAWRIGIYVGLLAVTILILLGGLGIILFGGLGIAQALEQLLSP
ncbi:MAG: sigma factor-like helix-turn-helix DNA-binding protein [Sphingopyxis sp.]